MLSYSLTPDPDRRDTDSAYATLFSQYPYMRHWTDSMLQSGALRDTFVTMPSGERHHALYARCDSAHGRTAIVVHGYKDCAVKFLYLGHMYHHDLGYNILLPDLHAHGLSDGEEIQMGWKDRKDVIKWTEIAERTFRDNTAESQIVVHGVSMGAATTMCRRRATATVCYGICRRLRLHRRMGRVHSAAERTVRAARLPADAGDERIVPHKIRMEFRRGVAAETGSQVSPPHALHTR